MDSKPSQPTKDPRRHLVARAIAIAEGAQKPNKEFKITYRISGGPPKKRLDRTLEISGKGSITLRHFDELTARRVRESKSTMSIDRIKEVFRYLVESRLLENVDTGGGFLPDSVIGAITISDGLSAITYHFLGDEQQRRLRGVELNPSVASFSSLLESLSEELNRRGRK